MARSRPIPNADIICLTTTVFGIPEEALRVKTKDRDVIRCRQVAMFLCNIYGVERRTKQVGSLFGQTVSTAHAAFQALPMHMDKDEHLANRVACLRSLLSEGPEAIAARLAPYRSKPALNFSKAADQSSNLRL